MRVFRFFPDFRFFYPARDHSRDRCKSDEFYYMGGEGWGAPDGRKSRFRQPNLRNFSGDDPRTPCAHGGRKKNPDPPTAFSGFSRFSHSHAWFLQVCWLQQIHSFMVSEWLILLPKKQNVKKAHLNGHNCSKHWHWDPSEIVGIISSIC